MAEIFLSYASQDRERVRPLVEVLEALDYSVWWADRSIAPGATFDLEIEKALDAAVCVIVAWSEFSIRSDWVRNEATEAHDRGVLLPIRLDDIRLPLAYRRVQTADLSRWDGDPSDSQFESLAAIVEEMVRRVGHTDELRPKAAAVPTHSESTAGVESDARPSIAVLPFSNLSRDDEYEFLADGMTDEIITLLTADPNLVVVARNSTFSYKGEYPNARQVADELGARYVVEGSVRAAGDRIRLTVQLVDAESSTQVWAKRFDNAIGQIFDAQDDVVDAIVSSLGSEVYRAEGERSRARPPESLNAWGLVVRAATELGKLGTSGFEQVIDLCRRAIEVNPQTPLAYSLLALALAMRSVFSPRESDRAEALKLVEEAMARANDNPLVLTYSANALGWLGQGQRAISIVRRSIDLAPNIATSYGALASAHVMSGNFEEAIEYANQAISMSPRDLSLGRWHTTKANAQFSLGQWQEAYEAAATATERMPEFASAWAFKASSLLEMGQYEESLAAAKTATELAPRWETSWRVLADALKYLDEYDSAIDAAQRAVDLGGNWRPLVTLADTLGRAGLIADARSAWDRATVMNPELSLEYLEKRPEGTWDGLRAAGLQ